MSRKGVQSLDPEALKARQNLPPETQEVLNKARNQPLAELMSGREPSPVSKEEEKALTDLGIQIELDEKLNKK